MARVPTWAELRLDVTKLAQLQNECYRSVHHMLDHSIPELDSKLSRLKKGGGDKNRMQELEARFQALSTKKFALGGDEPYDGPPRASQSQPQTNQVTVPKVVSPEPRKYTEQPRHQAARQLFSNNNILKPAIKKSTSHPANGFLPRQPSPPKPVYEEIVDDPDDEYFKFQGVYDGFATKRMSTPEPDAANMKATTTRPVYEPDRPKLRTNGYNKPQLQTDGLNKPQLQTNGFRKPRPPPEPVYERLEPDLDELEHLKPPPLPLSQYLKMNRPNVVEAANRRVAYLRKSAERRKLNASAKTINALDQIRAASRTSSNRGSSSLRSSLRGCMTRSSTGPNLTQIKCKLSEQEMKRLTAKTYNRLPEVKKQRIQEVTKHLKVQNYKNKLEYGRRLLENRRRGIINYPLKGHHDDSSVMSSLEESLTDSFGERSADAIKFDQYY